MACARLSTHQVWITDGHGATLVGPIDMNDGGPGEETPTGLFTVQWKDKDHRSREFNNAAMPYSVFFDTQGRAFHGGDPSRQSAGCIRLSAAHAATVFDRLQPGDQVQILS
jgi:lipoprotein-anchoring transpeptidase ErfK/SrfK